MPNRVETYSGYAADERPVRVEVDGSMVEVIEIVERWRAPLELGFRVRAADGKSYQVTKEAAAAGDGAWQIELLK